MAASTLHGLGSRSRIRVDTDESARSDSVVIYNGGDAESSEFRINIGFAYEIISMT